MSINRVTRSVDTTGAFSTKDVVWLRRARRIVLPHENLALHGLSYNSYKFPKDMSQNEIAAMAGDMFSGFSLMAMYISMLTYMPQM